MSILSWDDFEDDSQKPAAPEHKSAPIQPEKTSDSQNVSAAQPLEPIPCDQQIQPIQWLEHLKP